MAEDSVLYGNVEHSLGENTFIIDQYDYYNKNMYNYLEIHKERTQTS